MLPKIRNLSPEAEALWERRANALAAGSGLMSIKPDPDDWTREEQRKWLYALAISRRLGKLQ